MKRRVVITGMGIITSLGRGIDVTTKALKEGRSNIKRINSFDPSSHKTTLGGEVDPLQFENFSAGGADVHLWDRSSKLLFKATFDALMSAGIQSTESHPIIASFIAGTTLGGMLASQNFHRAALTGKNYKDRAPFVSDALATHQLLHVSEALKILGETLILNNACASSLSAVGLAYERIKMGDCDVAIAGGYEVMSDFTHAGFNVLQLVTSDACRPFDKGRSGLVLGEGAGVLVIETLEHALLRKAPVIAEIIGYGQASDAYHLTKPDPNALGASRAIKAAVDQAEIDPGAIDYVNAHGTGTPANDGMEAKALHMALGTHASKVPLSSTKPFMGHLLGAAGVVETIVSVITIQEQMAPENLNLRELDAECDLNVIRSGAQKLAIKTVLSNSFGFGGSNAAILLKRFIG